MKKRNLIIVAVTLGIFYFCRVVLGWEVFWIIGLYAVILVIMSFVFRAGFYYFMANLSFSVLKNREKSKALFLKSIAHGTKNPMTHLNYAILQMQDHNSEEALKHAKIALEMNPDIMADKNARLTISGAYWHMGEIDMATRTLEEMREKYDYVNAHVLTSLGYLYIVQGDLEKAREATDKAIEDEPASGAAWDNMGQIHMGEGDLEKAEETFLKALSFKDNLVDPCYFLGQIYEGRGNKSLAKEYFVRAKGCKLSKLNTVTQDMVDKKYNEYIDYTDPESALDEAMDEGSGQDMETEE